MIRIKGKEVDELRIYIEKIENNNRELRVSESDAGRYRELLEVRNRELTEWSTKFSRLEQSYK